MIMRECKKCKVENPLTSSYFHIDKGCNPPFKSICKTCANEVRRKSRKYYESDKLRNTKNHLRNNYNLSLKDYDALYEKQGGFCYICDKNETVVHGASKQVQRLTVDHDHQTGKVRGLLCSMCNKGLGCFYDSVENLLQAALYLEKNNYE